MLFAKQSLGSHTLLLLKVLAEVMRLTIPVPVAENLEARERAQKRLDALREE